jgi:hypothetical protein
MVDAKSRENLRNACLRVKQAKTNIDLNPKFSKQSDNKSLRLRLP